MLRGQGLGSLGQSFGWGGSRCQGVLENARVRVVGSGVHVFQCARRVQLPVSRVFRSDRDVLVECFCVQKQSS